MKLIVAEGKERQHPQRRDHLLFEPHSMSCGMHPNIPKEGGRCQSIQNLVINLLLCKKLGYGLHPPEAYILLECKKHYNSRQCIFLFSKIPTSKMYIEKFNAANIETY